MSDYLGLTGQRALVTGGSQGIGEAVVAQLRAAGAKVLTTARSMPPELPYAELFVAADVATAEGCATVAGRSHDRLGGVDIVVHVVGGSSAPGGGFAALDDDAWHRALNHNLLPAVRLDRALLPGMLAAGIGRDRPYHLDPTPVAAAGVHHGLRRGQGGAVELQQGFVQGGESEGRSRGQGSAWLGRDGRALSAWWRGWPRRRTPTMRPPVRA